MEEKKVEPVFRPNTKGCGDTSNIDKSFLNERPVDSPVYSKLTSSQQAKAYFDKFTYAKDDQDFLMNTDTNADGIM